MLAIIISKKDIASVNISKILLSSYDWEKNQKVYIRKDRLLYFIEDEHLYHDGVDAELEKAGYDIDTIIFASRHSSREERKTLSVHPVGNFGKAEYGGKDGELVKTNAKLMRNALELLKEKSMGLDYEASYEATHHGPWLEKPAFFIEVGSTSRQWNDMEACSIVAETIMEMREENYEIAIGVGGGHYAPRFTDIAMKNGVAFGHIAARYALPYLNEKMLIKMMEATPGCERVYFHGKHPEIEDIARKIGIY